jgi:hypothetical protein
MRPTITALMATLMGLHGALQAAPQKALGETASTVAETIAQSATADTGAAKDSGSASAGHGASLPELSPPGDGHQAPAPGPESHLTGFRDFDGEANNQGQALWVDDKASQLKGLGVSLAPSDRSLNALSVETAYLRKGTETTHDPASPGPNSVWSVGLTGRFWDQALRLRGEYAASRREPAQWGHDDHDSSGDAYNLQLAFQPGPIGMAAAPLHWRVTLDRRAAESSFWTLGEAPGGHLTDRAAGELGWGRLYASVAYTRSRRLDHENTADTQWNQRSVSGQLSYHAGQPGWIPLAGHFLGSPRFTLQLDHTENAVTDPVAGRDTSAIMASFDPGPWQWQVSHTRARSYGRTAPVVGLQSLTRLHARWPIHGALTLEPVLTRDVNRDPRSGHARRMTTGELLTTATVIRDRLDTRFHLNTQLHDDDLNRFEQRHSYIDSALDWILRPQRGSNPRVSLSLSGRFETWRASSGGGRDDSQYRIHALFEAAWPDA